MLASVLSGLPRLFRSVWSAWERPSRYAAPAPCDQALLELTAALKPVIDAHCRSLAAAGAGGPTVVEIHRVLTQAGRPAREAISVSVEEHGCVRRLILEGHPQRRSAAAHALVRWLERDTPPVA